MHIQTQPMASAVHVEVAVVASLDEAVHIPDQQAQVHQALHQNSQSGVVHRLRRAAGSHNGNRSFLSLQHQAVELPLFRREAAIHREGTGDVAVVVILQRTTGIDQQQVTVLQRGRVGGVVQHAGVITASDDGSVGRTAGPVAAEVGLHRRLHLGFVHARAGDRSGQLVGF